MAKSTTINLFLVDGNANGRIKCTISGRTDILYKIPRQDLAKSKNLAPLENDGVYFLVGTEGGRQKIYVGQAGSRKNGKGILNRLTEHDRNPDKNFWTEAFVLTTSDNSFGATEISWLEHKFCNMAIKAARYEVTNGNDPSPGNITEEKAIDLENHVEFAELVLSAIGYKFFEPPDNHDEEEIFYLSRHIKKLGRKINAQMQRTSTGYKVLAGSEISSHEVPNLSVPLQNRRKSAKIVDGKLVEAEEFKSSSTAAEFVLGRTASGPREWKKKDGVKLKDFLQGGN